jgi:TonB family protein
MAAAQSSLPAPTTGALVHPLEATPFLPVAGQPRFREPAAIRIALNPADTSTSVRPARGQRPPDYPGEARADGRQGMVTIAMVINDSGRVELPTATYLRSVGGREFATSLCRHLSKLRFEFVRGAPARSLVVMPFIFTLSGSVPPILPDHKLLTDSLRALPKDSLLARLEKGQHCA